MRVHAGGGFARLEEAGCCDLVLSGPWTCPSYSGTPPGGVSWAALPPAPTLPPLLVGGRSRAGLGNARLKSLTGLMEYEPIACAPYQTVPEGPTLFQLRKNPFVRSDDASLKQQDIFASAQRDGKMLMLEVPRQEWEPSDESRRSRLLHRLGDDR